MSKYAYAAVFTPAEEGGFTVNFPDLPNCFTDGDTIAEALEMAKDVLCLTLYGLEEDRKDIPQPTELAQIHTEQGEFVSLVACDTLEYRRFFDKKAVKKTLTIPNWLNNIAERNEVNFSAVLQEALIEKLHLNP